MTAYAINHAAALPGVQAGTGPAQRRTYLNGEASTSIPTGIAVKQGATDNTAKLITATTDAIVGIVLYSDQYALNIDVDSVGLKPGTPMSLLTRGVVWVTVEEAVNAGDRAFVRFAAGAGGSQTGAFRKSADTATARQMQGARYLTSAAQGGLAMLEFDANVDRDANS